MSYILCSNDKQNLRGASFETEAVPRLGERTMHVHYRQ